MLSIERFGRIDVLVNNAGYGKHYVWSTMLETLDGLVGYLNQILTVVHAAPLNPTKKMPEARNRGWTTTQRWREREEPWMRRSGYACGCCPDRIWPM